MDEPPQARNGRYEDALRTAVARALAPFGAAAADVQEGYVEDSHVWGIDVRPGASGAAPVSLVYLEGDSVVVNFGRTDVEFWDEDAGHLSRWVERFLEAVFAGRFVEAGGQFGDGFALVTLNDGTRTSVGRFHMPWPWQLRRGRRYSSYASTG